MKCLILAAGYATRMYPLTENFPKPLLDVGGKKILDWLIDDIDTAGVIDRYIVVSNHKYIHHFIDWAAAKPMDITVVDDGSETNESRLGAVKDISFALAQEQTADDMLVIAGDNVMDFSLTSFIRYAQQKKTSCVMRYYEPEEKKLRKSGVLVIDPDDRVLKMQEKPAEPASHWCCPPFYFYTREDAGRIEEGISAGCGTDAPGSYIEWLCGKTAVHAMEMPGRRYDVGTLETYEKIKREYQGITIR